MVLTPELLGTWIGLTYVYPHMVLAFSQLVMIYFQSPIVNMLSRGETNATSTNS